MLGIRQEEDDQMEPAMQGYAPASNDVANMRGTLQQQAYPAKQLYRAMTPGQVPAGMPTDRRSSKYLQSGGVPSMTRGNSPVGFAEDANGQEALRNLYIRNLRVR